MPYNIGNEYYVNVVEKLKGGVLYCNIEDLSDTFRFLWFKDHKDDNYNNYLWDYFYTNKELRKMKLEKIYER